MCLFESRRQVFLSGGGSQVSWPESLCEEVKKLLKKIASNWPNSCYFGLKLILYLLSFGVLFLAQNEYLHLHATDYVIHACDGTVLLQVQMVRETPAASFVRPDLLCVNGPDTRMESRYCAAVQ